MNERHDAVRTYAVGGRVKIADERSVDKALPDGVWCAACNGTGYDTTTPQVKCCRRCDGYGTIPWWNYRGPLTPPPDATTT